MGRRAALLLARARPVVVVHARLRWTGPTIAKASAFSSEHGLTKVKYFVRLEDDDGAKPPVGRTLEQLWVAQGVDWKNPKDQRRAFVPKELYFLLGLELVCVACAPSLGRAQPAALALS
jgi:hypothetical protein